MASAESYQNLATAKALLSAVGSIAATVVMVRGVAHDLLPQELQEFIFSGIRNFFSRSSKQLTLVIEEFDGLSSNEIYDAAVVYLAQKISPKTRRLKISKPEKEKHFNITMERGEEVLDVYQGEKFNWVWICRKTESQSFYNSRSRTTTWRSEARSFELTFNNRNRDLVVNSYLPYIAKQAEMKKQEKRTVKIFTVDYQSMYDMSDLWTPVTLDHPATFETLAMDFDRKDMILSDLDRFLKRREYYRKVGKAWKRGYLLYGPPGTGKSSLIAAIANYLNFDIYDLELTQLSQNSELRKLLVMTANKSILVVEDIDCSIDLQEKLARRTRSDPDEFHQEDNNKVTLSGLLNFVDGLWSSCGDERIIIFTTNHIEKLDPALLRPGRMDVHINMSYCTPCGFKILSSNYLGIQDHVLFEEIENLIKDAKVTPAEVAEQLLKNDDPDASLHGLIQFMLKKIEEDKVSEAEKLKAELADKLKTESAEENEEESPELLSGDDN